MGVCDIAYKERIWGVVLEVIATLVYEIVVGNLFADEFFAAVNLITPFAIDIHAEILCKL